MDSHIMKLSRAPQKKLDFGMAPNVVVTQPEEKRRQIFLPGFAWKVLTEVSHKLQSIKFWH